MNLKTTLLLVVLIAVGAAGWFVYSRRTSAEASSPTVQYLDALKADDLTKVEVKLGERSYTLQRSGPKAEWTLPGGWPVRDREVEHLVGLLAGLRSRFVPLPMPDKSNLKKFGLDADTASVVLQTGKESHTLTLGEPDEKSNRFSTPTYLRLDNQNEIVRLAPGLIAKIDKGEDYFRQRRLFAIERVAKDDPLEKVQQVVATEIKVKGPEGAVELVKAGERWEMKEPTKDKVDPDKLQSLLTKLPDLWAEKFINNKLISVKETGLDQPSQVFTVTRPNGAALKLLVGNVSRMDVRKIMKPGQPNQFGMPPEPKMELVHEEYRFARLENNDQVFEVKGNVLKDLTTAPSELRDPQLARFKTADVDRVEIAKDKDVIVLAKKDDKWFVEKPAALDAETSQVNDLLNKLADLRARDKDVLDKADLKKLGLEPPAVTVKIHVEEKDKEGKTVKKSENLVFHLAPVVEGKDKKDEKEKDKFYVQVEGWPRVNVIEGDGLKLASRPALAYRNRRVLDLAAADVQKLEIARTGEEFTLEQKDGSWKMTAPTNVDVDAGKAGGLAGDLAKLDAVEYVTAEPKKEDLDSTYGLAKPALHVKIVYKDEKKKPQTLSVGKAKDDKGEFYARLDDGPIFVVKKGLHDDLDRGSLAYRANQLWDLEPDRIAGLTIQKDGEYRLEREGKEWKIVAPFKAVPVASLVREMVDEVGNLKVEKFVAAGVKDLTTYGLDKPYLQVKITPAKAEEKVEPKDEKKDDKKNDKKEEKKADAPKERTLVLGKEIDKGRYAKLADGDAVFVVNEKLVEAIDRSALDLLDKNLLSVSIRDIEQVKIAGDKMKLTLAEEKGQWKVVESPAPPFNAEKDVVQDFLRTAGNLRADKIVAYGDKLDLAAFGLDKPAFTITLKTAAPEAKAQEKDKIDDKEKAKEKDKAVEHLIQVSGDMKGKRYVRVDKSPAIALLSPVAAEDLVKTHLDFVNPLVLELDFAGVEKILRKEGKDELEIVKSGDNWQVKKPFDKPADTITVEQKILERLIRLKADKVAEYPAKDLASFGLDNPVAVVTFKSEKDDRVVKLGKAVGDGGQRYALVDKGDKVVVLPAELSKSLLMTSLNFSDRNLAFLSGADEVTLDRGGRKVAFKKADGVWKMVEPIKAGAEESDLDALLRDLYRLRADEMVAEKADLSKFGLDKPAAQWKLTANKKDLLHLLVGKAEGDKSEGRLYAKLANSDLVFLLNPKTSAKVLDEYRGRKVLENFDAAQVDKLIVKGPSAAETFTLVKKDGDWSVAGKLDGKLDAKKVSETLDALARLKAERFIQDVKADLQIHGLVPPAWKIEVETSGGKRVLEVGRAEGMSKSFYATAPGLDAVFILSQVDADKILRPLKGFE